MQMKTKYLFFLFLAVITFSCHLQQKPTLEYGEDNVMIINVDPKQVDNIEISEIIEDVEFIPLSSSDEAILGEIERISVKNEMVFIHDRTSHEIKIFNLKGDFIGKISNQHKGPGGYIDIDAFSVTEDGSIVEIYDNRQFKFLKYNLENDFLGQVQVDYLVQDFVVDSEGGKVVYTGFLPSYQMDGFPIQNRLLICDSSGIKNMGLQYHYNEDMTKVVGSPYNFFNNGDTVGLAAERLSNEIFYILKDTIFLKYKVSFGKYDSPVNYRSSLSEIKYFVNSGNLSNYASLGQVLETADYVFFNYAFNNIGCFFLYNKRMKKGNNVAGFFVDKETKIGLPFPQCVYKDRFIGLLDGYSFNNHINQFKEKKMELPSKLKPLVGKVSPLSNPILVFIKFKKSY